MEERELHALAALGNFRCWLSNRSHRGIVCLQLLQNGVGTLDDALRHTRYFGHMDTKRVLATTTFQFTQEDYLAVQFLYRYVIVLDALKVLLHLVQLMIVSGEERASLRLGMFVQIFDDSPRYGDAVVGRRTTAQLVEQHQRTRRHII